MAVYNWSNVVTAWHFNPDNVRDPTIVFNSTARAYGSAGTGYDGTAYDFSPKNFAPHVDVQKPSVWTTILLDQFGIDSSAKEVILTGNCGQTGPDKWSGLIYAWFRAPGSSWDLSPIVDGGYVGNICVHAPVGLVNGVPAIEMAWGTQGLSPTNFGTGNTTGDHAWMTLIISGWGS